MRAIYCTKYGPPEVLKIVDIEKPVPKENELLVKVIATTVSIADWRIRGFNVPLSYWLLARLALGIFKPRQPILGTEFSGIIESVGQNVTKFKIGDKVFAFPGAKLGSYVEYKCMNEQDPIAIKPDNLSFEQAAALSFGSCAALYFLQKGNVTKGEKILIYGASGSVGTAAVQIAKYLGAEVTGVCSTGNLELVKSIGADKVIDYTKTDFADMQGKFDVVFDAVGKLGIAKAISLIKPQGRYLHAVATPFTTLKIRFRLLGSNIKFVGGDSKATVEQINFIKNLADKGFFKPVIDRIYPFDEIVAAHEYVDKGHKKGNVTIKIV